MSVLILGGCRPPAGAPRPAIPTHTSPPQVSGGVISCSTGKVESQLRPICLLLLFGGVMTAWREDPRLMVTFYVHQHPWKSHSEVSIKGQTPIWYLIIWVKNFTWALLEKFSINKMFSGLQDNVYPCKVRQHGSVSLPSPSAVPVTRLAWLKCKTPAVQHPPWPELPRLIAPCCFKVDLRDREQILLRSAAAGVHGVSLQMEIPLSSGQVGQDFAKKINTGFTSVTSPCHFKIVHSTATAATLIYRNTWL